LTPFDVIPGSGRGDVDHILVHARLRVIGRAGEIEYELPMTQEQLRDAMGLTPVHVNPVLKMLEQEGLITRDKRRIKVRDWGGQARRISTSGICISSRAEGSRRPARNLRRSGGG
jgi:hypothetical protein